MICLTFAVPTTMRFPKSGIFFWIHKIIQSEQGFIVSISVSFTIKLWSGIFYRAGMSSEGISGIWSFQALLLENHSGFQTIWFKSFLFWLSQNYTKWTRISALNLRFFHYEMIVWYVLWSGVVLAGYFGMNWFFQGYFSRIIQVIKWFGFKTLLK